ncbi:MAG: TonB-dependent receptor, partial [Verrucomicrobia bacterium]|nr:TonB-dependent receptor [Verrucomicrobiota bacterium]
MAFHNQHTPALLWCCAVAVVLTGSHALATTNAYCHADLIVTAPALPHRHLGATSTQDRTLTALTSADHAGDTIALLSGTTVTEGDKGESRVRLRGFNAGQITLLVDGIPLYEPFFHTIDLRHLPAYWIESITVVKGAGSVLYGPNTMGGTLRVTTRRPDEGATTIHARAGENGALRMQAATVARTTNTAIVAGLTRNQSDGFDWNSSSGRQLRTNSDYDDISLMVKAYVWPRENVEITGGFSYIDSEYGIPTATEVYRPRYWRFSSWKRLVSSIGATWLSQSGASLDAKAYVVQHENVLDAFSSSLFDERQWVSTYENETTGLLLLYALPSTQRHSIQGSLSVHHDDVCQQSNSGNAWDISAQETYSLGLEDVYTLGSVWKATAAIGIDRTEQRLSDDDELFNPVVGVTYEPRDSVDIYLSALHKSRFPSMREQYGVGGNPDLASETAESVEAGFHYKGTPRISGALFHTKVSDLITSTRDASGTATFANIGEARITGGELEAEVHLGPLTLGAGATLLDTQNQETRRPLDLLPETQFSVHASTEIPYGLSWTVWGVNAAA